MRAIFPILAVFLLASCSTFKFPHHSKPANNSDNDIAPEHKKPVDTSDEARRRFLVGGHWFDHYMSGFNFADGVTTYNRDGTFSAAYKSVSPGENANQPTQTQDTTWSGKWKIENGQLTEAITKTSAPERTPSDAQMVRGIVRLDRDGMVLMNANGNGNSYSRKKPKPTSVSFTPNVQ
jgi:hypothetical protein